MAAQPFDWSQFLTLAQELARRPQEASLRSSVSRAYYFVYNLALARAARNGFESIRGESTHVQLWRLYNDSPEGACIALGQIAQRLKEKRERADYSPVYARIQEEVPQVLTDAQDFAERLASLPDRHPSPSAVRHW